MKTKDTHKWLLLLAILLLGLTVGPVAAQGTTSWSLWLGTHYTGFNDYYYKVAEFDRGVEGFIPEFQLKYLHRNQTSNWGIHGWFYDPKRMNFTLQGTSLNLIHAKVTYSSFYRQWQRDLMENLVVREAKDRQGSAPGGKMITHNDNYPNQEYGFQRQQITTDIDFYIPGMKNIKLFVNHRSILESGTDQHMQTMHCWSCHVESRPVDLDRTTHSVSAGVEAKVANFLLTYQANYRQYKSDVGTVYALYDSAAHPVRGTKWTDPNTGKVSNYWVEFGSREIFTGESVPVVVPENLNKLVHKVKVKGNFGRAHLLAMYANSTTQNEEQSLSMKGNQANVKLDYLVARGNRLVAKAGYNRFENDPIFINIPPWRENRPGGGQTMAWTRYSNLTRTELLGSLEYIFQPNTKYRFSVLAGYNSRERDDYPYEGANDKTTKIRLQGSLRYRPGARFTGYVKVYHDMIDNPFAPYKHMFEHSAREANLTPLPDNSFVYYFQRDQLRYGDITMLPTSATGLKLDLTFRPTEALQLTAGINMSMGSNSDAPELDFKQTMYQPKLGFSYMLNDKFDFFGSYSYLYRTQNGIAAVAMMDG
jgi:hypothetical protein